MEKKRRGATILILLSTFLVGVAAGVLADHLVRKELRALFFLGYFSDGLDALEEARYLDALENLYYAKYLDPADIEPDVSLVEVYAHIDEDLYEEHRANTLRRIESALELSPNDRWLQKIRERYREDTAVD